MTSDLHSSLCSYMFCASPSKTQKGEKSNESPIKRKVHKNIISYHFLIGDSIYIYIYINIQGIQLNISLKIQSSYICIIDCTKFNLRPYLTNQLTICKEINRENKYILKVQESNLLSAAMLVHKASRLLEIYYARPPSISPVA